MSKSFVFILGGLFGLFVGMSLLSAFEVLYWLAFLPFHLNFKEQKQNLPEEVGIKEPDKKDDKQVSFLFE